MTRLLTAPDGWLLPGCCGGGLIPRLIAEPGSYIHINTTNNNNIIAITNNTKLVPIYHITSVPSVVQCCAPPHLPQFLQTDAAKPSLAPSRQQQRCYNFSPVRCCDPGNQGYDDKSIKSNCPLPTVTVTTYLNCFRLKRWHYCRDCNGIVDAMFPPLLWRWRCWRWRNPS